MIAWCYQYGMWADRSKWSAATIEGIEVCKCWWYYGWLLVGNSGGSCPKQYNWHGYKQLFQIVRELRLKLQVCIFHITQTCFVWSCWCNLWIFNAKVVMSFHECGGNVGDDVCISLPHWVTKIGWSNPDIFFTDWEGRRNHECLSWGIDKERVLRGRMAVDV